MITAIVRYPLPAGIGREACRAHFERIAPGFGTVPGLIQKQFIWSENGVAGGVYCWQSLEDARRFYQGPWLDGILERYGAYPEIEYFTTFAVTDNPGGRVTLPAAPA
jgi:Putative mono-oxygenase ydhR